MPANSRWDLIRRLRVNKKVATFWQFFLPPQTAFCICLYLLTAPPNTRINSGEVKNEIGSLVQACFSSTNIVGIATSYGMDDPMFKARWI